MSVRQLALALGLCGVCVSDSTVQGQSIPEFNKLRTPSSPAFVLLGVSPTRIQRPNTPATVAASLSDAFGEGNRAPTGYSIEVAPYWLLPHPSLTLDNYKNDPASMLRTLTLSLGTSDSAAAAENGGKTKLALGVRSMLISSAGGPSVDSTCIVNAQRAGARLAQAIGEIVNPMIQTNPDLTVEQVEELRQSAFETALERAPADVKKEVEESTKECVDILSVNRGFTLDIAGGGAWSFDDGSWDAGRFATAGIWLTPAWKLNDNSDLVGIASVMWQGLDSDSTQTMLDVGIRGIHAWKSVGISAETIYRHTRGGEVDNNQFRVDLGLDIEMVDGLWLTSTFGKDFNASGARSLLAIANLQWNIGDRSINPRAPD